MNRSHRARFRPDVQGLESRALLTATPHRPLARPPAAVLRVASTWPATTVPFPQSSAPYRDPASYEMHRVSYEGLADLLVQQAVQSQARVAFLGDSLTAFWAYEGQAAWNTSFGRFRPANLGIGSDLVQNLLWRVERGAVAWQPRVAVVMTGINNLVYTDNTPAETVDGIKAVVGAIQRQSPRTRVLVLSVLPTADAGLLPTIRETNARLAQAAPAGRFAFLDLTARFLGPSGQTSASYFHDGLHLTPASYGRIAPAIAAGIARLL